MSSKLTKAYTTHDKVWVKSMPQYFLWLEAFWLFLSLISFGLCHLSFCPVFQQLTCGTNWVQICLLLVWDLFETATLWLFHIVVYCPGSEKDRIEESSLAAVDTMVTATLLKCPLGCFYWSHSHKSEDMLTFLQNDLTFKPRLIIIPQEIAV